MRITLVLMAAGWMTGTGAALAQDAAAGVAAAPVTLTTAERRAAVNSALVRLSDPTLHAVVSGPVPALLLEASAGSRAASGRIGFQAGDVVVDVKLQGVMNTDTGRAVLADLDGLRHTSTADLGLLWTNYPRAVTRTAREAAGRSCRQARGIAEERPAPPAEPGCGPAEVARHLSSRRLFVAGVNYRVGPEDFRYVTAAGAEPVTTSRVHWSVGGRAGLAFTDRTSAGVIYAHTVVYRSGESRFLCEPLEGGRLQCADQIVGAPTRSRVRTLTIEARHLFADGLGITPRVVVGLGSRSVLVEWPVYFLRGTKGGLAGGITAGWRHSRTAGSGFLLTLFAGQSVGVLFR